MEVSAPFSELSPASLIVQSSRFSPTEGKLASHCLREACLTGYKKEEKKYIYKKKKEEKEKNDKNHKVMCNS